MDGHFVPNITFGPPVVAAIRRLTTLPLDTHLMITDPDRYLEAFRSAGADILTVHYETCPHLNRTVRRIRELGAKAGVVINPATPVAMLEDIVAEVDLILIMSVNPGFGGQAFLPGSVEKLREAAALIRSAQRPIHLEIDGGIDATTAPQVVQAGATVLVAGSFVFRSSDIPAAIRTLRSAER
jgi:ribulose-phosphate 3-epimerase